MTIENLEKKLQDREEGREFYQALNRDVINPNNRRNKTIEARAEECVSILENLETTAYYFN